MKKCIQRRPSHYMELPAKLGPIKYEMHHEDEAEFKIARTKI